MEGLTFSTAILTEKHQRRQNEDFADYIRLGSCGCWVVADGLGGHAGGEVASKMAVETIISAFDRHQEITVPAINGYLEAAQAALRQRQQEEPQLSEMRTTIVLLVADLQGARWAHVGDSRLYHFHQARIISQTRDHSVPQALANAGEIKKEDIRFHEDRHRLLRALGQDGDLRPTIQKEQQPLATGDAFLLCTDGFWEMVLESEMEADLGQAVTPQEWLQTMQARILKRSSRDTGRQHDNFTAMAVFVQQPPTFGLVNHGGKEDDGQS